MEKERKTHIATICRLEKVITPSEAKLVILIPIEIAEGTIDRCKNFVDTTGEKYLSAEDALEKNDDIGYILEKSFDNIYGHGLEVLTLYYGHDYSKLKGESIDIIRNDFENEYKDQLKHGVWYFDVTELVPVLSYDDDGSFYEEYCISLDHENGVISTEPPKEDDDEAEDEEDFEPIKNSNDSSESTPTSEKVDKKVAEEKKISFANLKLKTTRKQLIADTKMRVISQDKAVERVCSAVYDPICLGINALKRNILLYGPSGSGKTYLVSTIAKLLGIPYAYQNVSKLSVSGYVGDSVNDIYTNLYLSAGGDMKKLERGAIVILDEIDKLKGTGDIKEGAYHELLDLLDDGGTVNFQPDKHHDGTIQYHKENLQVFSAGTFARMLKLQERQVGFGAKNSKIDIVTRTYNFTPEDFIEHGYPAEIMNRHKLCIPMNGLTEEDYYKILTQSIDSTYVQTKNSLLEHRKINLIILEEALRYIAKTAFDLKKGARGLSGVFDDAIQPEIDTITDGIDEGRDIAGDYEIKEEEIVKRLGSLYPLKQQKN